MNADMQQIISSRKSVHFTFRVAVRRDTMWTRCGFEASNSKWKVKKLNRRAKLWRRKEIFTDDTWFTPGTTRKHLTLIIIIIKSVMLAVVCSVEGFCSVQTHGIPTYYMPGYLIKKIGQLFAPSASSLVKNSPRRTLSMRLDKSQSRSRHIYDEVLYQTGIECKSFGP